jgi:prepilin-type N-terminal cleavage/methylation domain-containing protein
MDRPLKLPSDAGFTIIELLVAVAIASLVVIGIGGLFAIGSQVRSRAADNVAVQTALIDLQAMMSLATSELGLAITTPSDAGFGLAVLERTRTGLEGWGVHLIRSPSNLEIELRRGNNASSVNLSAFDTATLEYLDVTSHSPKWVGVTGGQGDEVRAARLRLGLGARVWRPLIWIPSNYGQPPQ